MHVLATAGHVDHGKSTLVRALTGSDPDRLAEEKRRGLTIRLGYCWTELDPVGEVAFVDVPGHDRFLPTTLSGLGPAPAVLFVVAADDPWMPQAAEHLAALDALGVRHGVLAVTRADLADPGPALATARAQLAGTGLAGAPAVAVSGRTGQGLAELRAALGAMLAAIPAPDPATPARLWADRSFHLRGSGTIVTGTLPAGTIAVGDRLVTDAVEVRVRGIQALSSDTDRVVGPARVALDLGGGVGRSVAEGSVLVAPEAYRWTSEIDVRLRGDGDPPRGPLLHIGALACAVHVRPLGNGYARLGLERPLPLRAGDRAILRDPGDRRMWGVAVLDPDPVPLRRRGAAGRHATALAGFDGGMAAPLRVRGAARRSELARSGFADDLDAAAGDEWLLDPARASELAARLTELVTAAGVDGISPADAARRLGLPDPVLLRALPGPAPIERGGRLVAGIGLGEAESRALAALAAELADEPFAAPDADRLRELGIDDAMLARLARAGRLVRPAPGIALGPGAVNEAVSRLAELPQPFTASEARRALGTSRRVALPLLDHLDRSGRTVRLPDDRRRLRT